MVAPASARAGSRDEVKIPQDVKNHLTVLHDGKGHVIVIKPKLRGDHHFYYGDGKKMYAQTVRSGSADRKRQKFSRSFWAPRSKRRWGYIYKEGDKWWITCDKRRTDLKLAGPRLIAKALSAKFYKSLWKRTPFALARDEMGIYYYIDRLQDEYGGKGYRLFVGPRGRMKKTRLVNIVRDSEGSIFATKKGALRLVLNKRDAAWIHRGKRTKLTYVPPRRNAYMIYVELGVYTGKRMGVPCDDL
jgi:hypothetical protein